MRNVNILRAVEKIGPNTSAYTPLDEMSVNAIQAIEQKAVSDGEVEIIVERMPQIDSSEELSAVDSFLIKDNGVGFTEENRDSFDTIFSDLNISQGGKGFGRFIFLKYFEELEVSSVFSADGSYRLRKFRMGKQTELIIAEECVETTKKTTGTTLALRGAKGRKFSDRNFLQ